MRLKTRVFWPLASTLLLADCATKRLAEERLVTEYVPHPWLGEYIQFTLAFNPGAAMGLHLGPFSRVGFTLLTIGVLVILWRTYRKAAPTDAPLAFALALICGGALGNLLDRLRSARGVTDFIDIGVGDVRFYTFNIADVGVSLGAIALSILLWRRDGEPLISEPVAGVPGPADSADHQPPSAPAAQP